MAASCRRAIPSCTRWRRNEARGRARRRHHGRHRLRARAGETGRGRHPVERHRYAAMETSYANGGQLSASHAEVWNHKATIVNALKWMARRDAPCCCIPGPAGTS
jgi:hypothetical protein